MDRLSKFKCKGYIDGTQLKNGGYPGGRSRSNAYIAAVLLVYPLVYPFKLYFNITQGIPYVYPCKWSER